MKAVVALLGLFGAGLLLAGQARAQAIELPADDKAVLERYLGKGVIGPALDRNPIADAAKFFVFKPNAWTFQFAAGDRKGDKEQVVFTPLKRDSTGQTGRMALGAKDIRFLRRDPDGTIRMVSEQDIGEGLIFHYNPPQPLYLQGLKPGDSKTETMSIKTYDLSHPDHLTHSGTLTLIYSYVGAYRVTVPAGSFDAALIKWDYKGNLGPASVTDTQYRLLVEGIGPVAVVEKKDISALLVYDKESKSGKVLVKHK